jgi:hypothetical protein
LGTTSPIGFELFRARKPEHLAARHQHGATIVTFLFVALPQNSQRRSEEAVHEKLDAIADGLADPMENLSDQGDRLVGDVADLRKAVGVERAR